MASLFGFEIRRKQETSDLPSFTPEYKDDGAVVVAAGGQYGTYIDLDGTVRTEAELVSKYREMAQQPEIDSAIEDIVNDSIVNEENVKTVELVLDDVKIANNVKKAITTEFDNILNLLDFNKYSYDIFKKWYIDGRLYYHVIIDDKKLNDGIKELRYIDPRKIRKIREISKKRDKSDPNASPIQKTAAEYYVYNDKGFQARAGAQAAMGSTNGLRIAKDSIVHVTSGLTDRDGTMVLSYMHKAIKPMNQLRALEDATLIYRLTRAPERLIFYVDVGNLPKMKAEQYLRDMMTRYKSRLVYDSNTGEIRDDRKMMTMTENYWMARREGARGTEITSLPAGQNLGELEDVKYFQRRLFRSLNVPFSRLDPESQYQLGRASEITREEVKFARFIDRLRARFSDLFIGCLEKQLILKKIMTPEEWDDFSKQFRFKFARDSFFAESKEMEILNDRINALNNISPYAGKYYSHEWIRKNVLRQTDDEIEEIDEQIQQEMNNPQYPQLGPDGQPIEQQPEEGPTETPSGASMPPQAPTQPQLGV
jgi:hypothetical protein